MDMSMSYSAAVTGMDMASSTLMDMATATGASAAASTAASMGDMGGMDMGMGGGSSCKISMLWNWYTIDSCFLASTWHIRSSGAFAGSCIGVIFLVISLELIRRAQREFDRWVVRQNASHVALASSRGSSTDVSNGERNPSTSKKTRTTIRMLGSGSTDYASRLKLWQQTVRSLLYMLQFAVGYFVMLLAMYYNGYIIIMIFIGAFFGAMIFQWDTFNSTVSAEQREACCS